MKSMYAKANMKAKGNGGMNMDARKSDRIKDSLARPKMGAKPSLTHSATKKGKNFMPKGMKGKK